MIREHLLNGIFYVKVNSASSTKGDPALGGSYAIATHLFIKFTKLVGYSSFYLKGVVCALKFMVILLS